MQHESSGFYVHSRLRIDGQMYGSPAFTLICLHAERRVAASGLRTSCRMQDWWSPSYWMGQHAVAVMPANR
jgi:hypothetical protein